MNKKKLKKYLRYLIPAAVLLLYLFCCIQISLAETNSNYNSAVSFYTYVSPTPTPAQSSRSSAESYIKSSGNYSSSSASNWQSASGSPSRSRGAASYIGPARPNYQVTTKTVPTTGSSGAFCGFGTYTIRTTAVPVNNSGRSAASYTGPARSRTSYFHRNHGGQTGNRAYAPAAHKTNYSYVGVGGQVRDSSASAILVPHGSLRYVPVDGSVSNSVKAGSYIAGSGNSSNWVAPVRRSNAYNGPVTNTSARTISYMPSNRNYNSSNYTPRDNSSINIRMPLPRLPSSIRVD